MNLEFHPMTIDGTPVPQWAQPAIWLLLLPALTVTLVAVLVALVAVILAVPALVVAKLIAEE